MCSRVLGTAHANTKKKRFFCIKYVYTFARFCCLGQYKSSYTPPYSLKKILWHLSKFPRRRRRKGDQNIGEALSTGRWTLRGKSATSDIPIRKYTRLCCKYNYTRGYTNSNISPYILKSYIRNVHIYAISQFLICIQSFVLFYAWIECRVV